MATWLNIAFVDIKFMYFFFSRSIYQGRDEIKRKEKKNEKDNTEGSISGRKYYYYNKFTIMW